MLFKPIWPKRGGKRNDWNKHFVNWGRSPKTETCDAMKGLITEGQEVIGLDGDPEVKDAALIAAAQRVEHYEIAGYGCAVVRSPAWS